MTLGFIRDIFVVINKGDWLPRGIAEFQHRRTLINWRAGPTGTRSCAVTADSACEVE